MCQGTGKPAFVTKGFHRLKELAGQVGLEFVLVRTDKAAGRTLRFKLYY